MDIKQLRSFLHVAETGSFSLAALRLNVTQPALSRQIRMLEEESGITLFIRTGRGVTLSEAGEKMVPHARLISEQLERLKIDMTAFAGTISGEVRLGLPPSVGTILAGPVVETFRLNYPHVHLRVTQMLSGGLQDALLKGRLDMGILFEGNVSPLLRSEALWSEQLFFVSAPVEPWISMDEITFADCLQQPFILPGPKHGLRDILEKEATKIGKKINVVIEAESLAVHMELVCRGLGATILSYGACAALVREKRLIALPLINPQIKRVCALVWPKDYPLSRGATAMAGVIRDTALKLFA